MLESQWWRIDLPDDWEEGSCTAKGSLYFESADRSKGFYICTWSFEGDERAAAAFLESIQRSDIERSAAMAGSQWKIIRQHRSVGNDGVERWRLDLYDASKNYRIQSQLLAKLPTVVRSTFHDYFVEDLGKSSEFFEPIISSLELKSSDELA